MGSQMQELLFVFFIKKPVDVMIFDKKLSLKYGDALLTKNTGRLYFSSRKDYFYEIAIDLDTINSYIQQNHLYSSEYKNVNYHIVRDIPYLELILSIIKNINITPHPHPQFRKFEMLALLAMIRSNAPIDSLIISSIPSFSDRVKSVIISTPSRKWMLHDISVLFHMSESLVKKKLLAENTSFSEILLKSRMDFAKNLLNEQKSIKQTAINCGFSNTSYFIQSFKKHYNTTPREYQLKVWKDKETNKINTNIC